MSIINIRYFIKFERLGNCMKQIDMQTFGLTEFDLNLCKEKIKNQKSYLENNELVTANGQVKTLLELSFSANHSERYYAQLANKINTIEQLAFNQGLSSNFLTCTLDGFYRDLLQGDYTRFKKLSIDLSIDDIKKKFKVPNNDIWGFVATKMFNNQLLDIKDLYNILCYQMQVFRKGYAFKRLLKANKSYAYIRTVEPHKDGVPHFHIMFFVPKEFIADFKKDFIKSFPAPQNAKPQLDINRRPIKDTLKGFQTDITSASAYIMKYITKTFRNIRDNKELDYINAWFIKHRIMRCVTSRSTLPQWVYQIVSRYEKDWYYLTDIFSSSNECEWSKEHNCFWLYDTWSNREIEFLYGRLSVYKDNILVHRSGEVIDKPYTMLSYEKIPKKWSNKPLASIPIYEDNNKIGFYKNNKFILYKDTKSVADKKDFELYKYFNDLDIETCNMQHYGYVKNTLIERGLLSGTVISLDDFRDIEDFKVVA